MLLNFLHDDHDHDHEAAEGILELITGTISHNILGLFGLIFAVVIIANMISYKVSGRQSDKKMGVLGGALLGLIPGCGGTVAVTSMYAKKKASFSAVLASFIATLGEGAFVIITSDPMAYLIISAVGFVVALIAGYAIDFFKIEDMLPAQKVKAAKVVKAKAKTSKGNQFAEEVITTYLFWPLMVLGAIFIPVTIMTNISEIIEHSGGHFFFDAHSAMESTFGIVISITISVLALAYWIGYGIVYKDKECCCSNNFKQTLVHGLRDVAMIISIITIATVATAVVVEHWIGTESIESFLTGWGVFLVVLAALIGAIPGCASYVVLIGIAMELGEVHQHSLLSGDHDHDHHHTLWGVLIAGGIATSGDGIFGLLAVSKEKAGLVTLFSIVLAIVVGVPIHLIFN